MRSHSKARLSLTSLLTTDFIVDEALILLKARGEPRLAIQLGALFFSENLALFHHLSEEDIQVAWQIFLTCTDKEWSFTDCTSKAIIEQLTINQGALIRSTLQTVWYNNGRVIKERIFPLRNA